MSGNIQNLPSCFHIATIVALQFHETWGQAMRWDPTTFSISEEGVKGDPPFFFHWQKSWLDSKSTQKGMLGMPGEDLYGQTAMCERRDDKKAN